MNQALHILRKDVRYLRREIVLILLLSIWHVIKERLGGPPYTGPGPYMWGPYMDVLLPIAAALVIARLIHAEALPGDKQFWLTRPYRWTSLLAAKIAFVVLFVSFPIFLARLIALLLMGFPLTWSLATLLWSHLLIFLAAGLPILAVAAMTTGTAEQTDRETFIFKRNILVDSRFYDAERSKPVTLYASVYATLFDSPKGKRR